ncbi:MAG: hypothetical protein RR764_05135 [Oscillospiraceae bacterium]
MIGKYTFRLDGKIMESISAIAKDNNTTTTKIVQDALKLYKDKNYMDAQATFLSQEILQTMQSTVDLLEHRINNRSNQLISSLAIQQFILSKVVADSLDVSPDALEVYRAQAAEFLRTNNRVLSLKELVE